MEIANRVARDEPSIGKTPVPAQVRRSSLPNPESTRTAVGAPKDLRHIEEKKIGDVKEEPKKEEVEEKIFSDVSEPEIRGTIVVTLYKNHPYDVEFSGDIKGSERDLAVRFIQKEYVIWKNKLAKKNEQAIKNKKLEDSGLKTKGIEDNKEKEDARN